MSLLWWDTKRLVVVVEALSADANALGNTCLSDQGDDRRREGCKSPMWGIMPFAYRNSFLCHSKRYWLTGACQCIVGGACASDDLHMQETHAVCMLAAVRRGRLSQPVPA